MPVMTLKITLASVLFFSLFSKSFANVYQCVDSSGSTTFRDTPCPSVEKKTVIEQDIVYPQYNKDAIQPIPFESKKVIEDPSWDSSFVNDDLTGESHCILFSKPIKVQISPKSFDSTELDIRITQDGLVLIKSGLDGVFSNETRRLGFKVGKNDFVEISDKSGARTLFFDKEKSSLLIKQMKSSNKIRGRVAFFPYEETNVDFEIPMTDFLYANELFEQCKQRHQNQ